MRDTLKNSRYFQNYISKQRRGIELFKQAFDKGGQGELSKEKAARVIFAYYLGVFTANYSVDAKNEELEIILNEMLPYLDFLDGEGYYIELLWVLSLSYILDFDTEKLQTLKQRIEENGYKDYLIGTLLEAIFGDENVKTDFTFETPYRKLKSVLDDKENAQIKDLEKYLTKYWYEGHSDSAWYETHKRDNLAYAGYWSFESAVIVKLFSLDDSSLKGVDYYPYDLLHQDE